MSLKQAILPVAGYGTRFLPWTKVVPKELLPIGNVPIIALLVDECLSVGISEIVFVISHGKEAIPQYFERKNELEKELEGRGKLHMLEELSKYHNVQFHTVYQNEMKGDGHALMQAKDLVASDHVAVLFGDDLIVGDRSGLQQLLDAHRTVREKKDVAMLCLQNVKKEHVGKYGVVDVLGEHPRMPSVRKVAGLVEKPHPDKAPSTLVIAGKYIIPRSTFDVLPKVQGSHGGEIRLIDALIAQLGTIDVYGHEFSGKRYDTGTPEGYSEAVRELA